MTKVELETLDSVRRRLAVEIPAGDVSAEIDRAYDRLRQTARVRGFRQGRAPRAVLEKLFAEQIQADVFGKLVHDSYQEALREQRIEPVGHPEIVTEEAEPGHPLRYSATIEVRPSVVASGYEGLRAERVVPVIDDDAVDRALEELRQSLARLQPIADRRRSAPGDIATIDYEARESGRVIGRGEGRRVEVGGETAESLGKYLGGAEIDAPISFDIDYPGDFPNPDLAGKRVHFDAVVKGLASKEVPALDDEFARTYAGATTLIGLREMMRRRLEEAAERDADRALRADLLERLVHAHDFEIPQAMVMRRTEMLLDQLLEELGPRRPPQSREGEVREQMRAELAPRAREQVKAGLLLDAIAIQEALGVDEAELDAEIERLAEGAGATQERVRSLYRDPAARVALRSRVLQERALDAVVQRANVETRRVSSGVAGGSGKG